jgi:hypothetical protein
VSHNGYQILGTIYVGHNGYHILGTIQIRVSDAYRIRVLGPKNGVSVHPSDDMV